MEERSEWLALDFTQKLIKDIKQEFVTTAVSASQGMHSSQDNSDKTQFLNGMSAGYIAAYETVMEKIYGVRVDKEDLLEREEVLKEYEA